MGRRRRKRRHSYSKFPYGYIVLLGVIIGLIELSSNFTYYLILAVVYIVFALIFRKHFKNPCLILNQAYKQDLNNQQNLRRLLRKIDAMNGEEFEIFLEGLYKKKGYKVERTSYVKDYGADLIITNASGKKAAVQAKRYKGNVGKSAIQEIYAAKSHYDCDFAIVVTNSDFTNPAQQLAQSCNVILWNREKLIEEIKNLQKQQGTKLVRLLLQR